MRRLIFFLTIWSGLHAQGQIEHLSDFDFSKEAIFYGTFTDPFILFDHGDYLIITRNDPKAYVTKVHQISTGETFDLEFAITQQHVIGDERFYIIRYPNGVGFNTRFVPPDGFTNYPYSFPSGLVSYNGAGYAVVQGVFKKYETNPYEVTDIADLSAASFEGYTEFFIEADTAYFAMRQSMIKVSLESGEIVEIHREAMANLGLELLPNSKLLDAHLYTSSTEEMLTFYELGFGGLFREIDLDLQVPSVSRYASFQGGLHFDKANIATNGDFTYFLDRFNGDGDRFLEQYLLRFDRRPKAGIAETIGSFVRYEYTLFSGASVWALNSGETAVVNGLMGNEGNEPYGLLSDSLVVLADLIPGAEGSVDYEVLSDYSNSRSFDNPQTWDGRALFLARHVRHGAELTISDGSPEGTGMLADLVPGGEGLLHVQFLEVNADSLLAFVQRDDLSFGLYLIGDDLPQPSSPSLPDQVATSYLALFPENHQSINFIPSRELNIKQDEDGSLYYLSTRLFWGYANGDEGPDPDFLEGQFQLQNYCQRLQKIDPQSGEIIYSKNFLIRPQGGGDSRDPSGLVVHPNGIIWVLNGKQGGFESEDASAPSGSGDLSLTAFGKDGEFIRTANFATNERNVRILNFDVLADGTMVALTDEGRGAVVQGYHLVTFSPEGELIRELDISAITTQTPNFWLTPDRTQVRLALYGASDDCADRTVVFRGYNSSLFFVELGRYCFSGDLLSPQVFDSSNGDRIFTGAVNGNLFENENNIGLSVNAGDEFYSAFVLRKSKANPALTEIEVISRSATHFFNTLPYGGELFIQWVDANEQAHEFVTAQLGADLKLAEAFRQPMKVFDAKAPVRLASGVHADRWWQYTAAGAYNKVHTDTIIPPPIYRLNHSEIRGIHRPWPFEPAQVTAPAAVSGDELFTVFPNPSIGNFYLQPNVDGDNPYEYFEVFDATGKLVLSGDMPATLLLFEISPGRSIGPGTYQLRFIGDERSENHRIVIL